MKEIKVKVDKITTTESEKGMGKSIVLVPVNDLDECDLTIKFTESPDKTHSIRRLFNKELKRGDQLEISLEPKNTQSTLTPTESEEEFVEEVADELKKKGIDVKTNVNVSEVENE